MKKADRDKHYGHIQFHKRNGMTLEAVLQYYGNDKRFEGLTLSDFTSMWFETEQDQKLEQEEMANQQEGHILWQRPEVVHPPASRETAISSYERW